MEKRLHNESKFTRLPGNFSLAKRRVSIVLSREIGLTLHLANSAFKKPKSNSALCITNLLFFKKFKSFPTDSENLGNFSRKLRDKPCTENAC